MLFNVILLPHFSPFCFASRFLPQNTIMLCKTWSALDIFPLLLFLCDSQKWNCWFKSIVIVASKLSSLKVRNNFYFHQQYMSAPFQRRVLILFNFYQSEKFKLFKLSIKFRYFFRCLLIYVLCPFSTPLLILLFVHLLRILLV